MEKILKYLRNAYFEKPETYMLNYSTTILFICLNFDIYSFYDY